MISLDKKEEEKKIHCIIWHTEGMAVSGLLSWMHRLRKTLPAAGVKLELASLQIQPFRFAQVDDSKKFYDYHITNAQEFLAFLKKNRNAVHLINHAFEYVGLIKQLSLGLLAQLKLVGICHTDQDYYYHHLREVNPYLSGMIGVSPCCVRRLEKFFPERKGAIATLPDWDMPVPPFEEVAMDSLKDKNRPLRMIFNGRILHLQKRVMDLPFITRALAKEGAFLELTIVGDGPDLPKLKREMGEGDHVPVRWVEALPPWEMEALVKEHDIFLQVSEFEGASVSLMEAMVQGLVPVVTRIESGIELLEEGRNALLMEVGDIEGIAKALKHLDDNREKIPDLARNAYETAKEHLEELDYANRFAEYMEGVGEKKAARTSSEFLASFLV